MVLEQASGRDFTSALREYAKAREMDNATACNVAAHRVAVRAVANTHHADPGKIEAELGGIVGHALTFLKSGKISKSKRSRLASIVSSHSLAYNIVAARIKRKGGTIPRSLELQRLAALMIRKRIASVNFIRAGWIPAIRKLSQLVGGAFSLPRARAGIGSVRIARPGHNVFAEIVNASVSKSKGSDEALVRYGGEGLTRAVDETREDMLEVCRHQLDQRGEEFNRS